jgi:protein-S-isoprenylcysteine O-methyltransferase Ste14
MNIKTVIFAVVALFIFVKFIPAFRSFKKHDFYMFFAFEALLVLLFLNIRFWFSDPFSWDKIISWVLLLSSILFALGGFYALIKYGKPKEGWEETTQLINRGAFYYIRHPLYTSLMLLAFGVFLKDVTWPSVVACFVTIISLVAASLVEEKENLEKFGKAYEQYIEGKRRYIPFVY